MKLWLYLFVFIIPALLTVSCSTSKKLTDKGDESFDSFYDKFHKDEAFQLSRLKFPMEGMTIDGNKKTKWTSKNWSPLKVRIYDVDKKQFKSSFKKSPTTFEQKIWIEDSGFMSEYKFKLIDKKWYLIYAYEQNL